MAQGVKALRVLGGQEPSSTQVHEHVVLVDANGQTVDLAALVARVEALENAGA